MSDESSNVSTVRFQNLGDANYDKWSPRMEADLIRKNLWDGIIEIIVDPKDKTPEQIAAEFELKKSKRKAQKMAEARAEMVLRVDDGQLSHMRSKDPMEIWANLRDVHRARGFATSLALRRKFLTAKKNDTQTMQAWIGNVQSLAYTIEEAGIPVTDQDKILALTMGLPPSYDAVIINFDSTAPSELTFQSVITRLLNDETRQLSSALPVPIPTAVIPDTIRIKSEENVAFAANSRGSRSDVTCHFCDKKGHYKTECREKQKWEDSKNTSAHVANDLDEW